jgi:hypothetical protein
LSQAFHCGLARLRALGHERRYAIMCADAVWLATLSAIIAHYLIAAGESVFPHSRPGMTDAAPRANGLLPFAAR